MKVLGRNNKHKSSLTGIKMLFGAALMCFTFASVAADLCSDIFADAAQSATSSGKIILNWNSRIYNSPDNILDTKNFIADGPANESCGGTVACIASNNVVPFVVYNNFSNNRPSVNLGFLGSQTINPGNYQNISIGTFATLTMRPGIYNVNGTLDLAYLSNLVVASAGTVSIYVKGNITVGTSADINPSGADRYVFLYGKSTADFYSGSNTRALVYTHQNATLSSGAEITGAVTSRDNIVLESPSYIYYDVNAAQNTDYDSNFCEASGGATLVAEWRLDALKWSGGSGEVLDYSGNNLHGSLVDYNGYSGTERVGSAISGDPGTCRFGNFKGQSDGYIQIPDPGNNSLLDLVEYSVSAWVYPRTYAYASSLMTVLSKDENYEFHITNTGTVNWWWGGGERELETASRVPLNTWTHVTVTYKSGRQVIYINGVESISKASTASVILNDDPILIGTELGFNTRNFDGYIDEVRIYNGALTSSEVMALTTAIHDCIPETDLDHFSIDVGAGGASTCLPRNITITALTFADQVATEYTGTVALTTSTSHGNWARTGTPSDAQGSLVPSATDSGAASYSFEATMLDQGQITLALSNHHAESLRVNVNDSANSVTATSGVLTFSENAFIVSSTDTLADDVIASREHAFQVEMIKNDPATGSCGPSEFYDTASVKTWITRAGGDAGAVAPVLRNAAGTSSATLGNSAPASNNINLPFVDGVANIYLTASDVGNYAINVRDDSLSFSDQPITGGTSASLIARPFGFSVVATGNPAASSAAGATFKKAGENFTVNVTAVGWQAADDLNNDGIPDGHNNNDASDNTILSDNPVLVSFGLESPAPALSLSTNLVAPSGGIQGAFLDSATSAAPLLSTFSNGTASLSTANYSEVGIMEIQARLENDTYLSVAPGVTQRSISNSGYIGRFFPDHFTLANLAIGEACAAGLDYSYMGETFELYYTVQAQNQLSAVTQNYVEDFAKLSASVGQISFGAKDNAGGVNMSARLASASGNFIADSVFSNWSAGASSVTSSVNVGRSAPPDGPYSRLAIGVKPVDSDNVTVVSAALDLDVDGDTTPDFVSIGETEVRFGRLRLDDAFGPETAALPIVFMTEFWDGPVWRTNNDDSCTAVPRSAIRFPSGNIDTDSNRVVTIGSSTTTGNFASLTVSDVLFSGGDAGAYFTAPGAGNIDNFNIDVDLTTLPWLRFDWDSNNNFDDTALPTATFTFGSYRGHDRVIYWHEVLR